MDSIKILVFSWNTQSINIAETMCEEEIKKNRNNCKIMGYNFSTWRYKCEKPDFFNNLIEIIEKENINIIVIGFQEDRFPGSYFHSHFLPNEMPKYGYELLKRTKLMGLGVTSYKNGKKGDFHERGLRMSIYVKKEEKKNIEQEETEMRKAMGNDGYDYYICSSTNPLNNFGAINYFTRGKGAIVSYVIIPSIGRFAFICCHLPFNSHSIDQQREYTNNFIRQNELNYSNTCYNNIIEQFVLSKTPQPDHIIFFGDLNYRISNYNQAGLIGYNFILNKLNLSYISNLYNNHDELKLQMNKSNIYSLSEGINNKGPLFLPTCKMKKSRFNPSINSIYWNFGKNNNRIPSWADRILYKSSLLTCTHYDRFDYGTLMCLSDHSAVFSIFST